MNGDKLFDCKLYGCSAAVDTTWPAQSPNTVCPIKALEVEDPSWLVDRNRLRSLGMAYLTTKFYLLFILLCSPVCCRHVD